MAHNEIIKEILLVKRNLDMTGSSLEPFSRVNDNERTPLLNRIVPTSLQHWGIVICFPDERRHAKLIEATYDRQRGKIHCIMSDWSIDMADWWNSMPGFEMTVIPMNGKKCFFNLDTIHRFLQRFNDSNDSNMSYDPIVNNCQIFVRELMSVLTLPEAVRCLPRPLHLTCSDLVYSFSASLFLIFLVYGDDFFHQWVLCYLKEIANLEGVDSLSYPLQIIWILVFALFCGQMTLIIFLSSKDIRKKFDNAIRRLILQFPMLFIRIILFFVFHVFCLCCITVFGLIFRDITTSCTGEKVCELFLDPEQSIKLFAQ